MKKITKEFLANNLPSGSGFDSEWHISEKDGIFTCKSEFHCLNESGFYDGFLPFIVVIDAMRPLDFRLFFTEDTDYADLQEYIDDTIADILR